jgi:hypothetical protein
MILVLFTRLAGVANLIAAGLTDTRGAIVQATIAASSYISCLSPTCRCRTPQENRFEDGVLMSRQMWGLLSDGIPSEIQIPGFLSILQRAAPLFEEARSFRLIEIGEQFCTNMDRLDRAAAIRRYHAFRAETEAHRTD